MTIVFLNGSLNPASTTRKLLEEVQTLLQKARYETDIINIGELDLPLFHPVRPAGAAADWLRERISSAEGLVVGSPEYHGSYSGALKNAIDYLDKDLLKGKPVGLLTSTGGLKGGINTLNGMRTVFRSLSAHAIPQQLAVSRKEYKDFILTEDCQKTLEQFVIGLDEALQHQAVAAHILLK
ncbi:hypothetical protein CHI12_08785 [Terribacillus saccharophilus]|jgi:azobenzene reductase|uniref:NADPH-dependent FMN reductase-like domain-containing protein n=1 Tax=Terribacillus saccharophilus TaxID=361277 RepID=A0A268HDG7_9BACI|nr:NADPH-dependent FMN reductase [Terribacillus saccharophilus]PAD34022.1 hypothetical protein CHH56_16645 [Terribacillus saccharophilus]PAD94733.1 hypothetical protein CHH50_16955 [Terribacillus saccharophilus]PAD98495.1 hypothetical protein CHH48_17050 [Terribacillus saccharophilus]PAE07926.1 hypothetical protein CHI12_08785 [Terribacillus saccharophilus]